MVGNTRSPCAPERLVIPQLGLYTGIVAPSARARPRPACGRSPASSSAGAPMAVTAHRGPRPPTQGRLLPLVMAHLPHRRLPDIDVGRFLVCRIASRRRFHHVWSGRATALHRGRPLGSVALEDDDLSPGGGSHTPTPGGHDRAARGDEAGFTVRPKQIMPLDVAAQFIIESASCRVNCEWGFGRGPHRGHTGPRSGGER